MSLNRCEQRVFDYLQRQREERQHWQGKFQAAAKGAADEWDAIDSLSGELWRYYVERCGVVREFREAAAREGLQRTSMKNLAELLHRLWIAPKPKRPPTTPAVGLTEADPAP
jgi:hypothetical protein